MAQSYFASVTPGLEAALLEELRALGAKKCKEEPGGVTFQATRPGFYRVLIWSGVASRLLLRVDEFRARDAQELHRKTARLPWPTLLPPKAPLEVDATTARSALNGTGQIADTVWFGISDTMRDARAALVHPITQDMDPLRLQARMSEDRCTLSLDAGPGPLYRRGWRAHVGPAPLRESTAAALLRLIGWRPGLPLLDPTCGSGTFILEAARRAASLPARMWPTYGVHRWANFEPEAWAQALDNAPTDSADAPRALLWGGDLDPAVIDAALANAQAAEVAAITRFEVADAEHLTLPEGPPGIIISNPPFGHRISRDRDSVDLTLLARFASVGQGWTLGLLLPSDFSPAHHALDVQEITRFRLGGMPVRFWRATHKAPSE